MKDILCQHFIQIPISISNLWYVWVLLFWKEIYGFAQSWSCLLSVDTIRPYLLLLRYCIFFSGLLFAWCYKKPVIEILVSGDFCLHFDKRFSHCHLAVGWISLATAHLFPHFYTFCQGLHFQSYRNWSPFSIHSPLRVSLQLSTHDTLASKCIQRSSRSAVYCPVKDNIEQFPAWRGKPKLSLVLLVYTHRQSWQAGLPQDFLSVSASWTLTSRIPITSTDASFSNLCQAASDHSAFHCHQSIQINANSLVFHKLMILHQLFRSTPIDQARPASNQERNLAL